MHVKNEIILSNYLLGWGLFEKLLIEILRVNSLTNEL